MRAAFFDVDGTLTKDRVWGGLLDYFRVHKIHLGIHYLFTTYHYSLYFLHKLGIISQITFRSIWAKDLSWYFSGLSEEEVKDIWDWVVEQRILDQIRWDMVEVLKTHKKQGDVVFLVSGGPQGLITRIAQEVGADYGIGTAMKLENGKFVGRASGPACQGEYKPLLVGKEIEKRKLDIQLNESYVYADSISDEHFLRMGGHPVAVYPEPELLQMAEDNGWDIIK